MKPTPSYPSLPPQPAWADDEIDLFELVAGLWQRKWIVLGVTSGFLALAIIYLLLTSPVYESETQLRPPLASQLIALNETGEMQLPPANAFSKVIFEARSLETQRDVFRAFSQRLLEEAPEDQEALIRYFLRSFVPSLSISIRGLDKNDVLTETSMAIRFQHSDSQLAADVVNALNTAAMDRALKGVLDDLRVMLETRIVVLETQINQSADNLKLSDQNVMVKLEEADGLKRRELLDQISALTEKAGQLRADRIVQLEEALAIAQSLDITEPVTLEMLARSRTGDESVSISTNLSQGRDPLYLRGSRLLGAELTVLRKRASDVHFAPNLRDLEEQLELLEHNRRIEMLQARENYVALAEGTDNLRAEIRTLRDLLGNNYEGVQLARVDQPAIARSMPIKPKKSLTLAIATLAGGMLGVLVALIMGAVGNRRQALPPPAADTTSTPPPPPPQP